MAKTAPCTPAADYRTDAPRSDGWTDERKATFLLTLAQTGVVSVACEAAEMSVSSAYLLRRAQRGAVFALGWKAAHLLARDLLEDRLLALALGGVESVAIRDDGITHRKALSPGLSMAVLNRLDRRAAALDDKEMGLVRRLCVRFDEFIDLILSGGDEAEMLAFLAATADPLEAPLAHIAQPQGEADATRKAPLAKPVIDPKLVEESAIFSHAPTASLAAIAAMAKRGVSDMAMAA